MQSSTAELITGLVQLVPLTNSTQLSQEAMEVSSSSFGATHTQLLGDSFVDVSCCGVHAVSRLCSFCTSRRPSSCGILIFPSRPSGTSGIEPVTSEGPPPF